MIFPNRIRFLVPGHDAPFNRFGGSIFAAELLDGLRAVGVQVDEVTYVQRTAGVLFLDDLAPCTGSEDASLMYWGPHLGALQRRLWGRRVIIFAQSFDYEFEISPQTAIIALSRFVQSCYALRFPHNPVYLLHPWISTEPYEPLVNRPTDVLHLSRKSALWLRQGPLLARLREAGLNVREINGFVKREEVLAAYLQAKVYVYSVDVPRIGIEGFGGQPLEALLHGCMVFTEFGAGLSDFLAFGPRVQQIGVGNVDYDLRRIMAAVRAYQPPSSVDLEFLRPLTDRERFRSRLTDILTDIDAFHAFAVAPATEIRYRELSARLEADRRRQLHPPLYRRVLAKMRRMVAALRHPDSGQA